MPSPLMPPTPADSTEIFGREKQQLSPSEQPLDLPSPAIPTKSTGHRPIQPASPKAFALPPPPSRSRKIIQVVPQSPSGKPSTQKRARPSERGCKSTGRNASAGKKTQNPTTAAGKKIARKTAHSVIERRRRSKMNEEFSTLKNMVPACKGQEMHKLAILQASIDYLQYLESCITDLKAANNKLSTPLVQPRAPGLRYEDEDSDQSDDEPNSDDEIDKVDDGMDTEMQEAAAAYISPESPIAKRRSSEHTSSQHRLPSPAFKLETSQPVSQQSWSAMSDSPTEPSPSMALSTQDEEASAALLMLNTDHRHSNAPKRSNRGLSVRDLLSN